MAAPELNINTNTAKGLEKAIGVIGTFIVNAQDRSNKILYGSGGAARPGASKFNNALRKGIIGVLKQLSDVDFCNIINYTINSVKLGDKSFDPNKPPQSNASQFEIDKWNLQKKAYDYQVIIDRYYKLYGTGQDPESRVSLLNMIKAINMAFDTILTSNGGLTDPNITRDFPEVSLITNYLKNAKQRLGRYSSAETIPSGDVQDVLDWVSKTRQILISIQALNTPAKLISNLDSLVGGDIQRQLRTVNELVDAPDRLIPRVKDLIKLVNNIIALGNVALRYINLAKTIITLALLLIRVFNILKAFFATLSLPAIFTTAGTNVVFSAKVYQETLKEQGETKLFQRLGQLNILLALMVIFVTSLVSAMNQILIILKAILLNLQSCSNADDSIKAELQNSISGLESTIVPLQRFLDDANSAQKNNEKNFGEYTIEILQEQLTDEGIALKRRYGVALDRNKVVVAQSTPTFASLDLIIINEVKTLLIAKGLVKTEVNEFSPENQLTMMESMKYLGEDGLSSVSIENVQGIEVDQTDQQEDTNEFVSNLPGGRAFRIKSRRRLIRQNEKLIADTKKSDPTGKYSKSIIEKKEKENVKLRIKNLEDEKGGIKIKIAALAVSPGGQVLIVSLVKRIKAIDQEIAELKAGSIPKIQASTSITRPT